MIYNPIGCTFSLDWPVYIEEAQTPLSEMDVKVYVECKRFKKLMSITINESTISFTFEGKDQKVTGVYDLILAINEGKTDQVIYKNKNAFTITQ